MAGGLEGGKGGLFQGLGGAKATTDRLRREEEAADLASVCKNKKRERKRERSPGGAPSEAHKAQATRETLAHARCCRSRALTRHTVGALLDHVFQPVPRG